MKKYIKSLMFIFVGIVCGFCSYYSVGLLFARHKEKEISVQIWLTGAAILLLILLAYDSEKLIETVLGGRNEII